MLEDEEKECVIEGEAITNDKAGKDIISLHSVNGFWVQRQLSKTIPTSLPLPTRQPPSLTFSTLN